VEQLDRARRIELEAMRKRIFSYGCNFSVMSVTYTRTNTSTMVVVLGHRRIATCLEHAKCSKDQGFQATTPPSGVRRWGSNPLAGEEARRRKRQGTHPPPRLHGFGRSHPNPMLITACLLHNAVRAGLIFAGISTLVIFAGITAKVRARSAHVRVPGECACLLPCIPSSGGELAQQEAAMASRCSSSTTRLLTDPCSPACLLRRRECPMIPLLLSRAAGRPSSCCASPIP
jgi:hypothetical protein